MYGNLICRYADCKTYLSETSFTSVAGAATVVAASSGTTVKVASLRSIRYQSERVSDVEDFKSAMVVDSILSIHKAHILCDHTSFCYSHEGLQYRFVRDKNKLIKKQRWIG